MRGLRKTKKPGWTPPALRWRGFLLGVSRNSFRPSPIGENLHFAQFFLRCSPSAPLTRRARHMADAADNIATAKLYLRRKFANNLTGLKALADKIADEALGDAVTLTGQSFEGGSHTGQLVFPRIDYLRAIEETIAYLDTDAAPDPSSATRAVFRACPTAYAPPCC